MKLPLNRTRVILVTALMVVSLLLLLLLYIDTNESLSIILFTIAVIAFTVLWPYQNRRESAKTEDDVLFTNESYAQAEKLAGLSIWRHNFHTRSNTFSDNFFTMLGIEKSDEGITFMSFIRLVHHDDRRIVADTFRKALQGQAPVNFTYRIRTRDGHTRYIKSVVRMVFDDNAPHYFIAISIDITDLVMNAHQLELRNRKLEAYNTNLASFNYVVSHDLQAPLRKINMFISRIRDTEWHNLTEQGREYFKRIHASSSNMQVLINDILMFSRTSTANNQFELTDLNSILDNAAEEVADMMEEKNASIRSDKLPSIYAIPYQLQQLFINLLSNSLKFAKQDEDAIITVKCGIVGKDDPELNELEEKISEEYYKLTFVDNGIGFEEQYAQKLFNLLFRINERNIYPGSGIGLAICRKIAENHFGFITAHGQPGVGAEFQIFLPTSLTNAGKS